jgi:transcriptional regulator with XRE-family HTH domain
VVSSHEHEQAAGRSRARGDYGTPAPGPAPGPAPESASGPAPADAEPEARSDAEAPRSGDARVIALRPGAGAASGGTAQPQPGERDAREPLWRHLVGAVLRRERVAQQRTLKDVAEAARISMPYLSEVERGRKEASSEVLAAAAHALGLGLGDVLTRVQSELARPARLARTSRSAGLARPAHPRHGAPRSLSARRGSAPHQGEVRLAA